jgi:60S ribosome subunit biogenesis protein NIP7
MRQLTEEETKIFFEKLAKYIGRNIKFLIDRPDEPHCFRLHNDRVYYLSESVLKVANSVGRDELHSMGTSMGKFTRSKKFRLHVTALDILAQYAKVCSYSGQSQRCVFVFCSSL